MDVNELTAAVQDAYRSRLAVFRSALLGPNGLPGARAVAHPSWKIQEFGPVRSLANSFADVTISADRAELAWLTGNPALAAQCVTVSVAVHHKVLGTRISLTSTDYVAWVQAVVGVSWMRFVYKAGVVTDFAGRTITQYFRGFLDQQSLPGLCPQEYEEAGLELVEG